MPNGPVVLVSLPWPRLDHCSIQLGSLASYAGLHGVEVRQRNYTKDLPAYISHRDYDAVSLNDLQQFEAAAFLRPSHVPKIRAHFERVLGKSRLDFDAFLAGMAQFYGDVVDDILSLRPSLVGFTVTFIQFLPAIYVATRLKERSEVKIVIGGASMLPHFSGTILEQFPCVDYIVEGEGEQTLVDLARAIPGDPAAICEIPGVCYRGPLGAQRKGPRSRLPDLDRVPPPDFSEQFSTRLRPSDDYVFPTITLEASRGCFYGKCTFCNLNCQWDNTFRMKSDDKVIDEIERLVRRERTFRIMFCDTNVSNRLSLFERLSRLGLDLDLILEVSGHADGRNKPFYRAIRDAGATQIQVGIEAFSDGLLRLIKKGVTVMKNVEIMKWCSELGVRLFYNLLFHIPGETSDDVESTVRMIKLLRYYQPPANVCEFIAGHDSPAWENPALFKIAGYQTPEEIAVCFPEEWVELAPLITPIVGFSTLSTVPYADWSAVFSAVRDWHVEHASRGGQVGIWYRDCADFLVIEMFEGSEIRYVKLRGFDRGVYLACDDESRTVEEVATLLEEDFDRVSAALERFAREGIMFSDGRRYLSLAVAHKDLHPVRPLRTALRG